MVPADWVPCRRPADGELVGYLVPVGDDYRPVNLVGYPLAEPSAEVPARAVLETRGLASLDDAWLWSAPDREVEVRLLEVSVDRVVVVETPYGMPGPDNPRHELTVPVSNLRPGRRR